MRAQASRSADVHKGYGCGAGKITALAGMRKIADRKLDLTHAGTGTENHRHVGKSDLGGMSRYHLAFKLDHEPFSSSSLVAVCVHACARARV